MGNSKMLSPWIVENIITGIVRGGAGLDGGNLAAEEGIRAPNSAPVLVDELRFTRSAGTAIPLDLRVTLGVGNQVICEDVPLDLLCKPLDFSLFKASPLSRTWHLPKPLYLPPGVALSAKARITDPFSAESSTFSLNVAAVGRSLKDSHSAPTPCAVDVPFAAHWTIKGTASGSNQSTPNDLRNKTRYTLDVERFSALAAVNSAVDDVGAALNGTLQLYGENGILGVRDETPFGALAFYGRTAWMARSKLPANGYYTVDFAYTLPTGESGPFTFGIAVIGSYSVPRSDL